MCALAIHLTGLLFLLACSGFAAAADLCEKGLAPSPTAGALAYMERGGSQRCEGIYVSPVSGAPVELVSFTRGPLSFDNSSPMTLLLGVVGKAPLSSPVHIRAVGIPSSLYYQMDAILPEDQTINWPLHDVVQPEKIAATDIGLYAFQTNQNAQEILLAVTISSSKNNLPENQSLVVSWRVEGVLHFKWRYIPTSETSGNLSQYNSEDTDLGRVTIQLPLDVRLPGRLEVLWDDEMTGRARVRTFALGG